MTSRSDARLVHSVLDGRLLPRDAPEELAPLVAAYAAHAAAPWLVDELARRHGIVEWNLPAYRRVFLKGALGAWHEEGGVRVETRGAVMRVTAGDCPIRALADRDPRACMACQALQVEAVRVALPGEVEDVAFESLVAKGAPACVARYALARGGKKKGGGKVSDGPSAPRPPAR